MKDNERYQTGNKVDILCRTRSSNKQFSSISWLE